MSDTQRLVMITGASRGIGLAMARRFAAQGDALAICGRREETITQVANDLQAEFSVAVEARAVDVADAASIQTFVQDMAKQFGRLDVLLNNAGITRDGLAMRMKADDWQQVIDTNLSSVFYASQAAIKVMMRARRGCIVNVSSVVASMGNPGQINYCASKGGVDAMTRSLAREVGSRGIRVNAIAPGFIATEMTAQLGDEAQDALAKQIPLGCLGAADDIAASACFLASDQASYITGQVLHVNGGMYM